MTNQVFLIKHYNQKAKIYTSYLLTIELTRPYYSLLKIPAYCCDITWLFLKFLLDCISQLILRIFISSAYATCISWNLYQSNELITSSLLVRMIRSAALNATTRIRARQKLPTIVERLRKPAENLFSTDSDLLLRVYIVQNY